MPNSINLFFVFCLVFISCQPKKNSIQTENIKKEIIQAEKKFTEMAQKEGIAKAFLFFAAEDAVLNRNNKIYKGKAAIEKYFEQLPSANETLVWEPEFVDISASGDMAYTYGPYNYSAINEEGDTIKSTGIFHTVWKKQGDGNWKFVWD